MVVNQIDNCLSIIIGTHNILKHEIRDIKTGIMGKLGQIWCQICLFTVFLWKKLKKKINSRFIYLLTKLRVIMVERTTWSTSQLFDKSYFVEQLVCRTTGTFYTLFFYKNILYKNIEAQNGPKVKNILRICWGSISFTNFSLLELFGSKD